MAKDEAIRHQKVFVRLDAVLKLQEERLRICREEEKSPQSWTTYRRGIDKTIDLLELPISTKRDY